MPMLVNFAARADIRDDNIGAYHGEKDSKAAHSRRSLLVTALQGFRVPRVEGIGAQLFELLPQPVAGRRVAAFEVLCGCPG